MKEITFRIGDPCDQNGIEIRCVDFDRQRSSAVLVDSMDLHASHVPFSTLLQYNLEKVLSYHDETDLDFRLLYDFILGLEREGDSK